MNVLRVRLPKLLVPSQAGLSSSLRVISLPTYRLHSSYFNFSGINSFRRCPAYYSSNAAPHLTQQDTQVDEQSQGSKKRKTPRSSATKNSLRRVAVEAERSRDGKDPKRTPASPHQTNTKVGNLCWLRRITLTNHVYHR